MTLAAHAQPCVPPFSLCLRCRDFDENADNMMDDMQDEGEEGDKEGEEGEEGADDVVEIDGPADGVAGHAVAVEDRITTPYMTKYERARILGTRALQIRYAAPSNQSHVRLKNGSACDRGISCRACQRRRGGCCGRLLPSSPVGKACSLNADLLPTASLFARAA